MKQWTGAFLMLVALVAPYSFGAQGQTESVGEAIALLKETGSPPSNSLRIGRENPQVRAIETLERAGSPAAVAALREFLTTPRRDGKLRTRALVALGTVGSSEAIAALDAFTTWADARRTTPASFVFGWQPFAVPHFSSSDVQPTMTADTANGRRFAIVQLPWPGWGAEYWVTSSQDRVTWDPLVFVGPSQQPEVLLRQIASGERPLDSFRADTDRDGLSDLMEARIGASPTTADSDGDGLPDGRDGNPLTPPHTPGDEAEIRQRMFEALIASNDSRDIVRLVTGPRMPLQEFVGYAGWVVPATSTERGHVNLTEMTVRLTSPTTAEATVTDYEAELAASGHRATLEKKQGRWVIVSFGMSFIS